MNAPRKGQQHKPSTWSRGRRDLASPQGLTLMLALMLCFAVTAVGVFLELVLKVPRNIVYSGVVIAYVVIITVALVKISKKNRQAAKARREAYQQKFEQNIEAIKSLDGRQKAGGKKS